MRGQDWNPSNDWVVTMRARTRNLVGITDIQEKLIAVPIRVKLSAVGKKISYYSAPVVLRWSTSHVPVVQ